MVLCFYKSISYTIMQKVPECRNFCNQSVWAMYVFCVWCYRPLFDGDNDFMICLKESFPHLRTRKLTRVEWCKIRRMMGKPRRCSQVRHVSHLVWLISLVVSQVCAVPGSVCILTLLCQMMHMLLCVVWPLNCQTIQNMHCRLWSFLYSRVLFFFCCP